MTELPETRPQVPAAAAIHTGKPPGIAIQARLDRWLAYVLAASMLVSLIVLVPGWMLDIDQLVRLAPGLPAMVPSTASLFLLASAGMLAWLFLRPSRTGASAIRGAAIAVFATAMLNLLIRAAGIAPGIDQILWPEDAMLAQESMSAATCAAFLLLAMAIHQVPARVPRGRLFAVAATASLSLALLALLVFVFDASALLSVAAFSTMAVSTATGFVVLSVALLLLRPDRGWVAILLAGGPASAAARRTLPTLLGIPLVLAVAASYGIRELAFEPNFALCLLATGTMLTLVTVVLRDAHRGNQFARERIAALERLEAARLQEAELRLERDRAAASAQAKSCFLANMSHELRTPMNGVLGFTELLLDSELTVDQRKFAELIAESGQSMVKLINEILDLSKVEAGHMTVHEERIDIHHVVRSSVRLMNAAATKKGIALELIIASDCPTFVMGDSLRIKQVLSNLIGNSVKFTTKGRVDVLLRTDVKMGQPQLEFTINDTGVGIPRDQHEAIFGEFQQAERSVERRDGGTGLGLAISRSLVELMGGRLILSSDEGAGTIVIVRLPLKLAEAADAARNASPSPQYAAPDAASAKVA